MKKVLILLILMVSSFLLVGCNIETLSNKERIIEIGKKADDCNTQFMQKNNDNLTGDEMNAEIIKNEIIDCKDIEKIVISLSVYSSISIYIDQKEEIELITDILNSDKKQIFHNVKYSFDDINFFIDIIYKEKTISIKILSDNDIYYFIDDNTYICTKSNHKLLVDFIIQKYTEIIPETNYQFVEKVK